MNGKYFGHDMIGLDDKPREVLAKIYLNRKKSYEDPIWVELYKDWILCTDKSLQGEGYELGKLKTKAAYYFEKIANKNGKEVHTK